MATQQATLPVADNGAAALLAKIFDNSGSLFGSGTTTSTTTPSSPANLTPLAPEDLDQMIQGIFDKAKVQFGPSVANSVAAGNRAYSDTTLADIQGRAQAQATAAAAAAKIDAITKNNQIAAQIATSNTTKTTTTAASPTGKFLQAAGIAAAGYSGIQKLKKAADANTIKETSDFFTNLGPGATANPLTGTASSEQAAQFFDGTSASVATPTLDTTALIDTSAATAADVLGIGSAAGDAAAGSLGTDAALTTGVDSTITDVAGGGLVDGLFAGATEDLAGGVVGDAVGGGLLEEAAPLALAAWIICTELNKQHRLPNRFYIHGSKVFLNYRDDFKVGYYIWAIPSVKHLRKYPNSLYSRFLAKVFNWRAEYLAALAGDKKAKKTIKGMLITKITYGICWGLGFVIHKTSLKDKCDWRVLNG